MTKILKMVSIGAACAISLAVAACATNGGSDTTVSQSISDINAKIKLLQADAAAACNGIIPTLTTAEELIGTLAGYGDTADAIAALAQGFCDAVKTPGASRSHPPVYRGVVIHYTRAHRHSRSSRVPRNPARVQ